jgi:HEAT repeat protein
MAGSVTARSRRPVLGSVLLAWLLAAMAGAGCSNYIGTTASSYLRRVREDPDPNTRYLAYAKLASPRCYDNEAQKAEAVKTLVEKLEKGREPIASRAVICRTLGELHDPAAREAVLKCVSDSEAVVRVEACRALGKVGKTEDATVLTRVMTVDTLEDCRIAAIEALGELKPDDPRIPQVLLVSLQSDDPATRLASLEALRRITGRDLGVDPAPWVKLLGDESTQTVIAAKDASPSKPSADVRPAATTPSKPATDTRPAATTASKPPAPSYPPRPPARPDPDIDASTRPAAYPPAPTTYVPR